MAGAGSFTAEQLSYRAGVPLRTVRYYLQQGLIDPPLGRGRGAHFDEHHLSQLQRARMLQNAGFDLAAIRDRADAIAADLARVSNPAQRARFLAAPLDLDPSTPRGPHRAARPPADETAADETTLRIPMATGVDLLVSGERPLPSPKALVEIALLIRKAFGET